MSLADIESFGDLLGIKFLLEEWFNSPGEENLESLVNFTLQHASDLVIGNLTLNPYLSEKKNWAPEISKLFSEIDLIGRLEKQFFSIADTNTTDAAKISDALVIVQTLHDFLNDQDGRWSY